jgi:shikimate kinase
MKNVIIIGMPAVGKSTIGSAIARRMGMKFIDTDEVIRSSCMSTLPDLIEKHGRDKFLLIEDRILSQIEAKKAVISTGGSAVYGENAMNHFKEIGTVLYIKISFEDIQKRLGRMKSRGVVIREGQTLKDLYDERCALYEKYADVTVEEGNNSTSATVEMCLLALRRAGAIK